MFYRYLLILVVALANLACTSFGMTKKQKEEAEYVAWCKKNEQNAYAADEDQQVVKFSKYLGEFPHALKRPLFNDLRDYFKCVRMYILRNQHFLWPAVLRCGNKLVLDDKAQLPKDARLLDYIHERLTRFKFASEMLKEDTGKEMMNCWTYSVNEENVTCDDPWVALSDHIMSFKDFIKDHPKLYTINAISLANYVNGTHSTHIHHQHLEKLRDQYTFKQLQFIASLASRPRAYRLTAQEQVIFLELNDETQRNLRANYPDIVF